MYRTAARSIPRRNLAASARRRMATVPPSGAPPTGTKPADVKPAYVETAPSGGGLNWPLLIGAGGAIAGGVWWFTRSPDEQAEVKAKGKKIEQKVEGKAHDLQRDGEQKGKDAQVGIEKKYADARASVVNAVDKAENKIENAFSTTSHDASHK
ncbi:hypothetical protein EXIGLDRAFT_836386 [Exidia glandulosa HHB12029]|uniref:Uncharacterized protein n=1 Tax=Exidia glandulosa HHB12029 TaxID=1314781 RepID=A0A165HUF5_EXIGL|nr:hypothetical protein EXIGLDRAFT_836386 [Exidia glandulosa HHB12029]